MLSTSSVFFQFTELYPRHSYSNVCILYLWYLDNPWHLGTLEFSRVNAGNFGWMENFWISLGLEYINKSYNHMYCSIYSVPLFTKNTKKFRNTNIYLPIIELIKFGKDHRIGLFSKFLPSLENVYFSVPRKKNCNFGK